MHFDRCVGTVNPSSTLAICAGKEDEMKTLKFKLYPLAIALIGVLAASGGYTRWR